MGSTQSSPRQDRRRNLQRATSEALRRARLTTVRETRSQRTGLFDSSFERNGTTSNRRRGPLAAATSPLGQDNSRSMNDNHGHNESQEDNLPEPNEADEEKETTEEGVQNIRETEASVLPGPLSHAVHSARRNSRCDRSDRNSRGDMMDLLKPVHTEDTQNFAERSVSFEQVQLEAVGEHQPLTPPQNRSVDALSLNMEVPPVMMMTDSVSLLDCNNSYSIKDGEDPVLFMTPGNLRMSSQGTDYSGNSSISDAEDEELYEFYPPVSRRYEWMGRSVESLVLGHIATAPILRLMEDDIDDQSQDDWSGHVAFRRRSTASTFGGDFSRRRGSVGSSYAGSRRGSLSLNTAQGGTMHGGTMANYFNRRRQMQPMDVDRSSDRPGRRGSTAYGPSGYRRRSTTSTGSSYFGANDVGNPADDVENLDQNNGGPNVAFSLMARELTGKTTSLRGTPPLQCLRAMGGATLYGALDRPAGGMGTELAFLAAAIDTGDWTETQTIVSRLAPRLIGDPSVVGAPGEVSPSGIDDPSLPPSASPYYAGGGRLGLERDAFVLAGGVKVLMRIFREESFVGQEMAQTYDARDLGEGLVATRLAPCWNEALASFRELIFAIPSLVEDGTILDDGEFLPFLFTLLSHDSCFDGAAALIEEILSLMSHSPQVAAGDADGMSNTPPLGRVPPVTTFFLGNVPDLYKLWQGFNCRQLAHFCRILALLVFEPEDRQLLESPAVLKSSELLQLRRNRAVRAGRDSTVDMNQAILLGDIELTRRLLKLLRVMNFAPTTRRSSAYHVMAHFPFIADTLVMLGLNELDSWDEIDRLDQLARKLLSESNTLEQEELLVSELGSVADMLENLSTTLVGNPSEPANQLGHIIHVISAAQQAGVVVDRPRQGRSRRRSRHSGDSQENDESNDDRDDSNSSLNMVRVPVDGTTIQGLASAASMLTDQVLVRRLYATVGQEAENYQADGGVQVVGIGVDRQGSEANEESITSGRLLMNPQDAANALQFNALLLGPYQVEVLFVLCTLLGGRRKIDAQEQLNRCGVIPVLDDMFQRLPWHLSSRGQSSPDENRDQSNGDGSSEGQQNGIHGPGCECTPESALCVQYLRLLHNFCDRDCDNYFGRHNLLSESEKASVLNGSMSDFDYLDQGLLSKIVGAFIRESDESPYRFWLASCIESYLRGSSSAEQVFVARSGLLEHLIEDVTSERLHCAGSLQTSFDLLGELCKGNHEVLRLLVADLDEESFRKLMSVAAANLVDSNVFIRSLWLSLERMSAANRQIPLHIDRNVPYGPQLNWVSPNGPATRTYLTHSWWDTVSIGLSDEEDSLSEQDDNCCSDWFPIIETIDASGLNFEASNRLPPATGLNESVGHFGWVFSPVGDTLAAATHQPNTMERLSWFLAANRARLLRDLLGVVDLRNINHENICCLNTAVVIAIFAHRRKELSSLLMELSEMNAEEKETKRRANDAAAENADFVDRAFVQAMRLLDIDQETPSYARRASIRASFVNAVIGTRIGDRTDVMRNFREVLWFWFEYYTHRGRDRLSLEFSSHLRFKEWMQVVSHLVADDGSPTSLVRSPVRLPRSPYQSAARISENPLRGV